MPDWPLHSVAVAAAVVDPEGRLLAIRRRDTGAWEPPGGVLELDETIPEGLKREVREETGLEVEPVQLTGVYKNMARHVVSLFFRCGVVGGSPRITEETSAWKWLTLDEACQRMTEAFAVRLLDAVAEERPFVRAHNGLRLL